MATTTTVHAQLIRYTTGGDQIVINLKSTASDVSVDRTSNSKIPSSVSTAQGLADVLGNLAFKDTIADATTSASGLMTAGMVSKLNGIASGANAYSHPTYTSRAAGLYKITVDGTGHVSAATAVGKSDITALGIPGQDTTYGVFAKATADANGASGLVPAPTKGQQGLYLRGDGTWGTPTNTVYTHPNSGVTAGTYRSVTVNAQGHVTAGSNPTTLAGYGITDAVSSSDSRLTNARPASDVSAWAKAPSKPSYSKSEVGLGNVDNTADSAKSVKYATSAGSANAVTWGNVTGKPSTYTPSSHTHTKSEVGLGNVDNTADSSKSVNYANTAGSSDSASSATKATRVVDYNNTDCTIDIGYKGSGITGDAIKYIAGYTTGANGSTARIKDVSKSALISWMGVLPGDSIFYVSKEAPSGPCIWAKID